MDTAPLMLSNDSLEVVVDPRRGADILQVRHRGRGVPLLFEVPWRGRAETIRSGGAPASVDSFGRWLEGDAGGWQVLCPNAGAERDVAGGQVGFHGEASIVPWEVVERSGRSLRLSVELFSVPVRIEREVNLDGGVVQVRDVVINTSGEEIGLTYSQHPALGGGLLAVPATLTTSATTFTADCEAPGPGLEPGGVHRWPYVRTREGELLDLGSVPGPGDPRVLFGWLSGLGPQAWAELASPACGLRVRLSWDGLELPYAWLWWELNGSSGFPWFGRARALAVEPATAVTSGPQRTDGLRFAAGQQRTFTVAMTVTSIPSEGR